MNEFKKLIHQSERVAINRMAGREDSLPIIALPARCITHYALQGGLKLTDTGNIDYSARQHIVNCDEPER